MVSRYGVDNPAKYKSFIIKKYDTLMKKYGVSNPMKHSDVINKSKETKRRAYTNHSIAKNNHDKFLQMVRENFLLEALISKDDYIGVQSRPDIKFRCIECQHEFEKRFDYASLPRCRVCYPAETHFKSKPELEMLEYVKSIYNGKIISGDRTAINPYEIDIYLPDLNIGIEHCGLYYHSELSGKKSWNYHYRKWNKANLKGIQLFTIFGDEWQEKCDIVKNLLKSKIGLSEKTTMARKCQVEEIKRSDALEFFDKYHLLGSPIRIPITFGLIYNNEIVSAMSFIFRNNQWQMTRFASKGSITGAASKLLNAFLKKYQPKSLITFSDNRYSNGRLYEQLGFVSDELVPPMDQYVEKYLVRHDKRKFTDIKISKKYSNITFNLKESNWKKMQLLKYDKIWDCGKIKWRWVNTQKK